MQFVAIPTEQTTAVTDGLLAVLALGGLTVLLPLQRYDPWKARIWSTALACLMIASAFGAIVHGIETGPRVHRLLWLLIWLCLGLLVAFFVIGTVYDLWGERAARRWAPVMIVAGLAFFAVTQLAGGAFVVFVMYEAAALGLALLGYAYLALIRRAPGVGLIAAGILVTLLAAVLQATRWLTPLTLIWTFDHNGLFHIVQMVGVALIVLGLRAAILRAPARRRD